jgi:hypothetical protein
MVRRESGGIVGTECAVMIVPDGFLANRYWNANGYAACAVAVKGEANDWAAYITGYDPESEREAILFAMKYGTKLDKRDALALFSPDRFSFVEKLAYRD